MSDESESVEAFFEGSSNVYEGAAVNFSSEKIVIREIGDANKHAYTNKQINDLGLLTSVAVGGGFGVTANGSSSGLSQSGTSGSGSGARFTVVANAAGNGVASVTVTTQGTGLQSR